MSSKIIVNKTYVNSWSEQSFDQDFPYIISNGIFAGQIDTRFWRTALEAYQGIGINRYGLFGVNKEIITDGDNSYTEINPKFLLTATNISLPGQWGFAEPGEFRVGDNVRESNGTLLGKNWIWYRPSTGLQIQGPLMQTVSSDANLIQSPDFSNPTEFTIINGFSWIELGGFEGAFFRASSMNNLASQLMVNGYKLISGAVVIRGSILCKKSSDFNGRFSIKAQFYDINNTIVGDANTVISTEAANPDEWYRKDFALRLDQSIVADSFRLFIEVSGVEDQSVFNGYIDFDNWNAYRVFQTAIDVGELPEKLPDEVTKAGVKIDISGIKAYNTYGHKTFDLSAVTGDAFFSGSMLVNGYVHSGPMYDTSECHTGDNAGLPKIVGVGINEYAVYGIAPNLDHDNCPIGSYCYYYGHPTFMLGATSFNFKAPFDKCGIWLWGDKIQQGEFRIGLGIRYDADNHELYWPTDYHDPANPSKRQKSRSYLWYWPGDIDKDDTDIRRYQKLELNGSVTVDGYVHSGPYYDLVPLGGDKWDAKIAGCGINMYAVYGIAPPSDYDPDNPETWKKGIAKFLLSNKEIIWNYDGNGTSDYYWGDGIFEGELRVGEAIRLDYQNMKLVDQDGNDSSAYLWYCPKYKEVIDGNPVEGPVLKVKGRIIVEGTDAKESVITPIAIDGVSDNGESIPGTDDILNSKQKWDDVELSSLADFLKPSQNIPIENGLYANDNYFGFRNSSLADIHWSFVVDKNGTTFIGNYSARKFLYYDLHPNSQHFGDLRIYGAIYADKGFFRDSLYVGDDTHGILIYGGQYANTNIDEYAIGDTNPSYYIRSVAPSTEFNQKGWLISNEGYSHFNTIHGVGRNINISTEYYFSDSNTRTFNGYSCGFMASHSAGNPEYPQCAIYTRSPNSEWEDTVVGFGVFQYNGYTDLMFYTMPEAYKAEIVCHGIQKIEFKTENNNGNAAEGVTIGGSGDKISFFGSSPAPKQTANDIDSLLNALAAYGLINKS